MNIAQAVRQVCRADPATWSGSLHLHLGGKTGEVLYASGCFLALRQAVPHAELVLHIHPRYAGIVDGLRHQPDRIDCYEVPTGCTNVADEVIACLHRLLRQAPRSTWWGGLTDLHTYLYRDHSLASGPFYLRFLRAAGLEEGWVRPVWQPPSVSGRRIALALPTANQHAGGPRVLPVSLPLWEELAAACRAQGLMPLATGHPDDGRIEMPGWEWIVTSQPDSVLSLLPNAEYVVGHNSGMVWAAILISPGRVTMFDAQRQAQGAYAFTRCTEVIDPARHQQIPWAGFSAELMRKAFV